MGCDGKNLEKPEKREKKCKIFSVGPRFFCKMASFFGRKQTLKRRVVCNLLMSRCFQEAEWFLAVKRAAD